MAKQYTKNSWVDEVISGAARYDIKDNGGASLYTQIQILIHNTISVVGSALTAAWMNNIETGIDVIDTKQADQDPITTAGTSTAFTLTTIGAPALTTGEHWRVKFNATAGATPTLNRDSKGAKSLKYMDGTGTKQSCGATSIFSGMYAEVVYDGTDYVVIDMTASGGGAWGSITGTLSSQTDLLYALEPQSGVVRNGKLSVTVASNNLTVALKTLAGNNPSASEPVYIYIGDAWRSITAALSVTKNAATNWCNAGGAELATKEIDYFAYLGYNATDGIVIGFSRIPYGTVYSDFSVTTTNEKYAAISTITNAAANDEYYVIGRFAATLSAGAGYTWTVPTFTAANLIQMPIFVTRALSWVPQITYGGGTTNPTSNTISRAVYLLNGRNLSQNIVSVLVRGSGNRTQTTFTAAFASPALTPINVMDGITAGGNKMAVAYVNNDNTIVVSETMANDGTYWINCLTVLS